MHPQFHTLSGQLYHTYDYQYQEKKLHNCLLFFLLAKHSAGVDAQIHTHTLTHTHK